MSTDSDDADGVAEKETAEGRGTMKKAKRGKVKWREATPPTVFSQRSGNPANGKVV